MTMRYHELNSPDHYIVFLDPIHAPHDDCTKEQHNKLHMPPNRCYSTWGVGHVNLVIEHFNQRTTRYYAGSFKNCLIVTYYWWKRLKKRKTDRLWWFPFVYFVEIQGTLIFAGELIDNGRTVKAGKIRSNEIDSAISYWKRPRYEPEPWKNSVTRYYAEIEQQKEWDRESAEYYRENPD